MDALAAIPGLPRTQGLSCKTFALPPLDGSLTLPDIYEWHAQNSAAHPLFVFSRQDGAITQVSWSDTARAIRIGARIVRQLMRYEPGMKDIPVIAILSASDSISYFTMVMAILRAGYIAFPISARNSPDAVAHLISKVKANTIFIGRDQAMVDLGQNAINILKSKAVDAVNLIIHPIPLYEDLFLDASEDPGDMLRAKSGLDQIVMYLHSSGSTSFPKPIARTNRRLLEIAIIPYFGERDLTGVVFSLHAVPMYHGMGIAQLCWTAACGLVNGVFEPKSPAQLPTPSSHFDAAVAVNSEFIFCVPAVIEAWSRNPEYLKWLATRGGVLYGGGPLNKEVGDNLISNGVSIFNVYASTEAGVANPFVPARVEQDWEYIKFARNVHAEMVPRGEGIYELVIVCNPFCRPSIINSKVNGVDAYATSDLFTQHPEKPDFWRVYGRSDDQIMHSTGEKVAFMLIYYSQTILNQDPHIQSAVMFGRGKFQAGVLIDPKPQYKFDSTNEKKLAEFRNAIWPTVQRMNRFAPQHSRVFKEMIIVSRPSKPFQYTVKNSARRQVILNDYAVEIDALYDTVADSAQSMIPPPQEWDLFSSIAFVRSIVNNVLKKSVNDDEDMFQHGCDSLQATWIRNTLLKALREGADLDTRHLVENFVYENPTISALGALLHSLASGADSSLPQDLASRVSAMKSMVNKYTPTFPQFQVQSAADSASREVGDVVLVTGTTGALGSYLLAELVEDPNVRKRQENALAERGLDPHRVLGSDKVSFLEVDLIRPEFGLVKDLYEEIITSTTHIIHNAWPVDFNLALPSFEKSVKGVRSLIDFSLNSARKSPPTLVFTSSVGVFQNTDSLSSATLPEGPISPEVAVKNGYTESKWVAEEILMQASKATPLKTVIVRVGQLCGGLNGAWNSSEWFPSLVKSSQVLRTFPSDERIVHWIPLQLAAKAMVDFRKSNPPKSTTFVHLVHPRQTSWSLISKIITAELNLELVSFEVWLAKLEELAPNNHNEVEAMRSIPALRLLPFYRSMSANRGLRITSLESSTAIRLSNTLADPSIAPLGEADVKTWLNYWRSVAFIT